MESTAKENERVALEIRVSCRIVLIGFPGRGQETGRHPGVCRSGRWRPSVGRAFPSWGDGDSQAGFRLPDQNPASWGVVPGLYLKTNQSQSDSRTQVGFLLAIIHVLSERCMH